MKGENFGIIDLYLGNTSGKINLIRDVPAQNLRFVSSVIQLVDVSFAIDNPVIYLEMSCFGDNIVANECNSFLIPLKVENISRTVGVQPVVAMYNATFQLKMSKALKEETEYRIVNRNSQQYSNTDVLSVSVLFEYKY